MISAVFHVDWCSTCPCSFEPQHTISLSQRVANLWTTSNKVCITCASAQHQYCVEEREMHKCVACMHQCSRWQC